MLKTELLQLIANGENSGVEFKRDDVRAEQLAKEIVAFANFFGGSVLLGVEEWERRLAGLSLMTARPAGSAACTVAGLVLFGRGPRRALRHAGVRWMSFAGLDKEYQSNHEPIAPVCGRQAGTGRLNQKLFFQPTDRPPGSIPTASDDGREWA